MIRRGPDFHRTVREADPVARAFPVEYHRTRRSRAPLFIAAAVAVAVALVIIHLTR